MKNHTRTASKQPHARVATLTGQQLTAATGGASDGGVIIVQNLTPGGGVIIVQNLMPGNGGVIIVEN